MGYTNFPSIGVPGVPSTGRYYKKKRKRRLMLSRGLPSESNPLYCPSNDNVTGT